MAPMKISQFFDKIIYKVKGIFLKANIEHEDPFRVQHTVIRYGKGFSVYLRLKAF